MSIADIPAAGGPEPDDGDSVLQSAVWLAQELGIELPPIPDIHVPALNEMALGRLYATDQSLLDLASRASLAHVLSRSGWPRGGLAFGFMPRGRIGVWFYTLVGSQQILHLSLRLICDSDEGISASAALVNQAHARLESHLRDETNYFRAAMAPALPADVPRHVIAYSDDSMALGETQATWLPGEGLSKFVAYPQVFSDPRPIDADGPVLRA